MPRSHSKAPWRRWLTAFCLAASGAVHAAGFPDHPITVVVPYPPGGAADIFGRAIANALQSSLKSTAVWWKTGRAPAAISAWAMSRAARPTATPWAWARSVRRASIQFLYSNMPFDPERRPRPDRPGIDHAQRDRGQREVAL